MKEIRKGFVEIPQTTLSALKSLLFDKDGEIVLSTLINDLSPNAEMRDLVAINVGLAFKGLKPNIDGRTRFSSDYRSLVKYEFISYSLILGVVNVKKTTASLPYSKDSELTTEDLGNWTNESFATIGYSEWLEMSTNEKEATTNLLNRWNKKNN